MRNLKRNLEEIVDHIEPFAIIAATALLTASAFAGFLVVMAALEEMFVSLNLAIGL